ncbi:MAG: hypothetical protein M3R36_14900 [Bacteroidota bacterium]|nr:hypothetical protein [Bacteroidota bacterium]
MTSAKFINSFFLLLIFLSPAFAQDKEDTISEIKEKVEAIHLDTALRSVILQNQEFLHDTSGAAGELTGFFKGKNIYKIYRSVGLPDGVEITEFYYRKNRLIFIRKKFNSYVYDDRLKTFDYTKMNSTFSGSYYFNNDKLIEYKTKGHNRIDDQTVSTEEILLNKSNEALGYIKNILN